MAARLARVSTAYTAYCFRLFSEIAREIGDEETAKEYRGLWEKMKLSYQAIRQRPEYSLDTDRQMWLLADHFGITPREGYLLLRE